MRVTSLDNFGEGFTVAPRKPHKQPVKHAKQTSARSNTTLAKVKRDLKKNGVIKVSDYENRSAVKNGVGKLRMLCWRIEVIKEGRKAVGYKLINRQ